MSKWCIGIDLGGTFIKFIALDTEGNRGEVYQLPTPTSRDDVVEQMITGAKHMISRLGAGDVVGVGIGSPGPLDLDNGVIIGMPNISGMTNVPVRDLVSNALSKPAVLENDANAAAFGEYLSTSGKDMVLLTLGTGLGSGIIIDGKLLHGAHGIGSEFGHMIIVPDGEPCGCGQRGCLERYCSATFIAVLATRAIRQDGRAGALSVLLDEKGSIDARDIVQASCDGDELAAEIWDRGTYYLALACVNICRIFDPDRIVFGGGMAKADQALMDPVNEHFGRLHWNLTEHMTALSLAQLGNDAGAIGAAGVAWQALGEG